jgi:hypothetical protein
VIHAETGDVFSRHRTRQAAGDTWRVRHSGLPVKIIRWPRHKAPGLRAAPPALSSPGRHAGGDDGARESQVMPTLRRRQRAPVLRWLARDEADSYQPATSRRPQHS